MSEALAIETSGLRKTYGAKVAVADLSLRVPRGEVFGFLGPNGSGKSTSVKMLLGLVAPGAGQARVLDAAPGHRPTMARIGFLPEHFRFHEWLSASELLDMHGRLCGMPRAARRARITELLSLVRLSEHARRPIAGFSKGMLQRIGLAQALLNHPELVFLDEPTSALDPFGRMLVRSIIHDLKQQGTTVFLNSHLLGEVEATCDRVTFIRAGRVLRTLSLAEAASQQVRVEVHLDTVSDSLLAALHALSGSAPQVVAVDAHATTRRAAHTPAAHHLHLLLPHEDMLPQVAAQVVESGARLYALVPQRLSLEELFLDIVGTEDSGQ